MPRTRQSLLWHHANIERSLADFRARKDVAHLTPREVEQTILSLERRLGVIVAALEQHAQSAQ